MTKDERPTIRKTFIAAATVILLVLAVAFIVEIADTLLLIFAGVLIAIFLRSLADGLSRLSRLPSGWALFVVLVSLTGAIALGGWALAPEVDAQVQELSE